MLYTEVALTRDVPTQNLKQGDVAVLVDFAPHPTGGEEGIVPITAITPLRSDQ